MDSYYNNKTIWITGASSGIGRAMSIELSKLGAKLILSSRKVEALNKVKQACTNPESVKILPLDLAQYQGFKALTDELITEVGPIDILINNGGISQRSFVKDTIIEVDEKLIQVNYLGTVALTKAVLPHMLEKNRGQFVTISSTAGKIGVPVRSSYCGAKHALHGFFESLRAELHKTNIAITMICPGFIKTDISKNALTSDGSAQNIMDDAQANGMSTEEFCKIALKAIAKRKPEVLIGGFKSTKMAVWVWRFFPNLLRKIIANSKVT